MTRLLNLNVYRLINSQPFLKIAAVIKNDDATTKMVKSKIL